MTTASQRPKILGTGLITLDWVVGLDPKQPAQFWAGGTCGNVLSILAFLDWDAYPIARLDNDPTSEQVKADIYRWGGRLDFIGCSPTVPVPLIAQRIRRRPDGSISHRFSWYCPDCKRWPLPRFKAITLQTVATVAPSLPNTAVFFMDRLSRATLKLAAIAKAEGALVVFEPSGRSSDPDLFSEALQIAPIIKYADQRIAVDVGLMRSDNAILLEIQTLGAKGLRYRHRFDPTPSSWIALPSLRAPRVVDTCGAGDWFTAGLLAKIATGAQAQFQRIKSPAEIEPALLYGQALAAWACAFEGARGGMYAVTREAFNIQIDAIVSMSGGVLKLPETAVASEVQSPCPLCA